MSRKIAKPVGAEEIRNISGEGAPAFFSTAAMFILVPALSELGGLWYLIDSRVCSGYGKDDLCT